MPINTYVNKVYGLIGAPRVGKNVIADFLTETRGFEQVAFADQIKEEFGVSKEDFEAAKIAGNIEELRNELWSFSADKKKKDPLYFINKVVDKVRNNDKNIVITDIRTEDELNAFFDMNIKTFKRKYKKIYWITKKLRDEIDPKTGNIMGSKLNADTITKKYIGNHIYDIGYLFNNINGLYQMYKSLDTFFFTEDLGDLIKSNSPNIIPYTQQFRITMKGRYD